MKKSEPMIAAPYSVDADARRGADALVRTWAPTDDALPLRGDALLPTSARLAATSLDNPASGGPRRRIGLHHIAFLRGYFEGLDPATLAEQYLDFGRDRKRAQTARRWIVDELVAAARKKGDKAGARLLKLPAGALPSVETDETKALSLDDFRDQVDPDGVFSESELLALHDEAQQDAAASANPVIASANRRAARNARLRQRQRLLLDSLEASLAEPPKLQHPVAHWLDPALAVRLESAGIVSVEDLITFVNRFGYRWYRRVHRVGEHSARRVLQWFDRNAHDLGVHLSSHARLPRSLWPASYHRDRRCPPSPDAIAPIESFTPSLSASQRDRDTLLTWLDGYRAVPATFRAYRTQAERLLLWSNTVARKPLAALTAADASAYMAFMMDPMPRATWCAKKTERGTAAWRPFEAPVSSTTVAVARRILRVLFDHLCLIGYVDGNSTANPFRIDNHRPATTASGQNIMKGLSGDELATHAILSVSDSRGADLSPRAAQADELRHLRMRVVLGVIRDTSAPLNALVSIPASAVARDEVARVGSSHASSGRHAIEADASMFRGRLSASTRSAIDAYLDMRRTNLSEPLDHQTFLIGRHQSAKALNEEPQALTPNVLGRAIAHYLKQANRRARGAMTAGLTGTATADDPIVHNADMPASPWSPATAVKLTPSRPPPGNYRQWRRVNRSVRPSLRRTSLSSERNVQTHGKHFEKKARLPPRHA